MVEAFNQCVLLIGGGRQFNFTQSAMAALSASNFARQSLAYIHRPQRLATENADLTKRWIAVRSLSLTPVLKISCRLSGKPRLR